MRIGITMGDPAGIGPEVILKALQDAKTRKTCDIIVLGDTSVLSNTARTLGIDYPYPSASISTGIDQLPRGVVICDFDNARDIPIGEASVESGRASMQYIDRAIDMALTGKIDAVVTGPINKQAILMAGIRFPGHTEILAQRTRTKHPVMMLAGPRIRVALVTTHLALKKVPGSLTQENIFRTIQITGKALKNLLRIAEPRIAVCGLNCHAGDAGRFGNEEARVIEPAIKQAQNRGINATGPHSADAIFVKAAAGEFDAVVVMYHDQGLIPLKLLHFDDAVNITLGLPIIRTSVDHGTAYDIAGQGKAQATSMIAAIRYAHRFALAKTWRQA